MAVTEECNPAFYTCSLLAFTKLNVRSVPQEAIVEKLMEKVGPLGKMVVSNLDVLPLMVCVEAVTSEHGAVGEGL